MMGRRGGRGGLGWVPRLLLVVVATCIGVLAAELAVRVLRPQNLSGSWRVVSPGGLWLNKSEGTATHQLGERRVRYRFAAPHLRGPVSRGRHRVLVLGDSFTFGWLLDDASHYVSVLERRVNAALGDGTVSLLNAAAGGWGVSDYAAYLDEFGDALQAEAVVVFLNTSDIVRALQSPLWELRPQPDGLHRRQVPVSPFKRLVNQVPLYQVALEHSHLVQLARHVATWPWVGESSSQGVPKARVASGQTLRKGDGRRTATSGALLGRALFRWMRDWCRQRDVPLIVVTTGWQMPPYTEGHDPAEEFMRQAATFFREEGIPFFDGAFSLWPLRKGEAGAFAIPLDGHPDEEGAARIADTVFPFIVKELGKLVQ